MVGPQAKKILVIDDEEAIRTAFRYFLDDLAYQVIEAENGRIGLTKFEQEQPDLVLLDLRMPEIDGLTVLERISKNSNDIPVIVISGAGQIEAVVQALRLGAWDYLVKPIVDMSVLQHAIQKALERHRFIVQERNYQQSLEKAVKQRTLELHKKATELRNKNIELEEAQALIQEKITALERTNQYKSEFLANMSHELRTPLNSILLLTRLLAENRNNNLLDKQIDFLKTINSSGVSLLEMINDILDLSKIESGRMELWVAMMEMGEIKRNIENQFRQLADQKQIRFRIVIGPDTPSVLPTDQKKVDQILKNLLSNAFKFTHQGQVTLTIDLAVNQARRIRTDLPLKDFLAFAVEDTGIGIAEDHQHLIFEAFRQADGSINRKYGGTGLGLSISQKMAQVLGGDIVYISELNRGSTFCLLLPLRPPAGRQTRETGDAIPYGNQAIAAPKISGRPGDPVEEASAGRHPEPGMDRIEDDRKHLVTAQATILIVGFSPQIAVRIRNLLRINQFNTIIGETAETALHLADYHQPELILIHSDSTDHPNRAILQRLQQNPRTPHVPILLLQEADNPPAARTGPGIKTLSMDRILSNPQSLPATIRQTLDRLPAISPQRNAEMDRQIFHNRKLLLVDDDMRNVYAILNVLQDFRMDILVARSIPESIQQLEKNPDINLVIMEIYFEKKAQYQAIETIRGLPDKQGIPLIILTSRVMKGERRKCLSHGATDWLAKPVEMERLVSMIRVWLLPIREDS